MTDSPETPETPAPVEHALRRLIVVPGGRPNINHTAEGAAEHAKARGLPIRFRLQPIILFADDRYYGWSGVIWTFEVRDLDQLLAFKDDMTAFAQKWATEGVAVEVTAEAAPEAVTDPVTPVGDDAGEVIE